MIDKPTVVRYIAQGLSTSQIAGAVGCDESYISQLKADPEIQQQVQAQLAEATVKDVNFDDLLETAEEKALRRIDASIAFAPLPQALAAFRVLNSARRRKDGPAVAPSTTTVNVVLTLPENAIPRYVVNSSNEIVEVEGRTMATATPAALNNILQSNGVTSDKIAAAQSKALEQAAARLSSLSIIQRRQPRTLSSLSVDMI